MDHGILDYLRRQSTEKLEMIRIIFLKEDKNSYNQYILQLVSQVLEERGDHPQNQQRE